jgi:hypothetical protein
MGFLYGKKHTVLQYVEKKRKLKKIPSNPPRASLYICVTVFNNDVVYNTIRNFTIARQHYLFIYSKTLYFFFKKKEKSNEKKKSAIILIQKRRLCLSPSFYHFDSFQY